MTITGLMRFRIQSKYPDGDVELVGMSRLSQFPLLRLARQLVPEMSRAVVGEEWLLRLELNNAGGVRGVKECRKLK